MKITYHQLSIIQLHELLKNKVITATELTQMALARLKKFAFLNAVVTELSKNAIQQAKAINSEDFNQDNYLMGIPFVMKDNIVTIGVKTTGSSKILENFIPPYDSTINQLLTKAQAINIAKTALDELGMGGDGLYAASGIVYNPWNIEHITGGSSSGSAALVAAGVVPYAIGTDTGDSIRKPAAYCGIVGFKPTYGLISRNGVFPYAPSLDTVGIFSNTVADSAIVFDCLVQADEQDFTSVASKTNQFFQNLKAEVKNQRIAILNYDQYQWNAPVKVAFDHAVSELELAGAKVAKINFDQKLLNSLLPVYMMISFAEATSCHAGLDGINFGNQQPGKDYQSMMINTRTKGFDTVVKRRYVIGAYVLSASHQTELFVKAKQVRRLIVDNLMELYQKYDAILMLPSVHPAPKISEVKAKNQLIRSEHAYMEDLLLLANLAGCPSITIPLTKYHDLPIGLNIMTAPFNDQTALNIAEFLSRKLNFKNDLLGEDHE